MAAQLNIIPKWTSGLFVPNKRSIGAIVAQVTISEQERDELTITEHPVEQGAPISDHAYKRPSEVTIRAGWSAAKSGNLSANGGGVYAMLLGWQATLHPFDLHTGKRSYKNMLIQQITVTTDSHSEFALMADIVCRQVIIVATKKTQAATNSNPANQADPASNAPPQEKGSQTAENVGTGPGVIIKDDPNAPGGSSGQPSLEAGAQAPERDFGSAGEYGAGKGDQNTPTGAQVEQGIDYNTQEIKDKKIMDDATATLGAIS